MSRFQLPADFFSTFTQQVERAQHSVYIQSLTLEVGTVMDQLAPALMRAAQRGVQVELHIDWIAREYVHGKIALTPIWRPSQRRYAAELHRKNKLMVQALKNAGVTVVFVNRPDWLGKVLAISGRNHIKMYMVDEKVVWLGGVNVLDLAVEHLDFMVSYTNETLIAALKQAFFAKQWQDEVVSFDEYSTLLIDGGKRGDSVIYDHALEMVEKARRSVTFVSQLVPEGELLAALARKAKTGCQVQVITSPTSMMQFSQWPYKMTYIRCKQALRQVGVKVTHLPEKVHCKLLVIDEREVIFGSHNLVETGIKLGTAEVSIQTTEPDLLHHLLSFLHSFGSLDGVVHHG